MKQQNSPSTIAHLVRGTVYLLLLLALFVIAFLGGHILTTVTTSRRSRD